MVGWFYCYGPEAAHHGIGTYRGGGCLLHGGQEAERENICIHGFLFSPPLVHWAPSLLYGATHIQGGSSFFS
jgi:hypothetical protein